MSMQRVLDASYGDGGWLGRNTGVIGRLGATASHKPWMDIMGEEIMKTFFFFRARVANHTKPKP